MLILEIKNECLAIFVKLMGITVLTERVKMIKHVLMQPLQV